MLTVLLFIGICFACRSGGKKKGAKKVKKSKEELAKVYKVLNPLKRDNKTQFKSVLVFKFSNI